MKIECQKCGKIIQSKNSVYHYKESGLENVYLKNIPVYECSCGTLYASIFRVIRLNDLIAKTLLEKTALLNGEEIKFLRKNLYLSSKKFSSALGLDKTTLSKWENNRQEHNERNDRFIRLSYIIYKGIQKKEAQRIFKFLEKVGLKKSTVNYLIIAEKVQDDYVVSWRPILEPQTQEFEKFFNL